MGIHIDTEKGLGFVELEKVGPPWQGGPEGVDGIKITIVFHETVRDRLTPDRFEEKLVIAVNKMEQEFIALLQGCD